MGESDWGTRLQRKANSNGSNNTSKSNNNKGPKFGTQVLNEGYNSTNNGLTRYEIAENNAIYGADNEKE